MERQIMDTIAGHAKGKGYVSTTSGQPTVESAVEAPFASTKSGKKIVENAAAGTFVRTTS
jgi:hypothetical protein